MTCDSPPNFVLWMMLGYLLADIVDKWTSIMRRHNKEQK